MSVRKDKAAKFSVGWWKMRHDHNYFPTMEQHKDWKVYDSMFDWFTDNADVRPEDDALEIGCGYGQWMVPMSRLVRTVTGCDLHTSLVAKAAEILAPYPNAKMVLNDGLSLPFPGDSFSFVYSISVFQHIPRAIVSAYFDETNRVLKAGGRLFFHFRHADGIGPYSDDIVENHTGHFSTGWTEQQAMDEASRAGFASPRTVVWNDCLILVAASGKVAT